MASDPFRSRWAWILAIVTLLVASTAAVGVWETVDAPEASPTFETDIADIQASMGVMTGLRETTIERDEETVRTVEQVWRRPGKGKYRIEDVGGTASDSVLKVSDGRTLWLYDSADGRVVQINLNGSATADSPSRIERLLTTLNRRSADEPARSSEISPLPVVPSEGGQAASTAGVAGSLTVSYEGTATVANRSTYVFELSSNANTTAFVSGFSQTLWLDQEWYVPLKRVTDYRRGDRNVSITVGYETVSFDSEIDHGQFRFDPPAGVALTTTERPRQLHFADRAGLQAASSFSLPDPSLADSFRLVDATWTVGHRVRSLGLQYANATARVTISKSNLTWYEPTTEGQPVNLGDQEAALRNLGTELRISWVCDGARYSVAGTGVSAEQLIEIARSVACE
ncbi:LolA family protein [Halorhabdus rudnickae]|uniref:LolA family protein n=1 Tax=Halorhabdus rudnickae TaxID=1775544 RepID=UPI0010846589|nr:outer membrane lipoprotein carrier protein LolA [Halorhabdus rudnickae]